MMGVIYIMWLRQLKRYWRSRSRMIGTLGQPILFLIALGFGFDAIFQQAGQGSYMQFLAPGVVAMSILFTSMFNGIEVIWDRQFGFLKETLVAPVSRFRIVIGRTLGGATVAFLQGILVLVISMFLGFSLSNFMGMPIALLFMLLIALLFTALGTAIASLMKDMNAFPLVMNFMIMPLFFLSGALFPVGNLPSFMGAIVRINPLSYGVDGLRGALSSSVFGLPLDFAVMVSCFVIVGAIGSYLFSRIEI